MFNGSEAGIVDEMVFSNNCPVHKCCRDGDAKTVSAILQSQPPLIASEDPFRNWTPIHWAAHFGHLDCVQQVVMVEPKTIHIQSSKTFQTPLHCASEGGHPLVVLSLLQAGANSKVKDILGETALHKAARSGNLECVRLLLGSFDNLRTQNMNGQTASAVAQMSGFPAIANFISQCENRFSSFQSRQIPRMSRKRTRDAVCDDEICKRRREDDEDALNYMETLTSSFFEHDMLCGMDQGYRNMLFETMLSEFHGC